MTKQAYNKLVRDRIPEIIAAEGKTPKTRILNKQEYYQALLKKLEEELLEFKADPSVEELADLQEVLLALADALNIGYNELAKMVSRKALARGSFKKRIFLESVED